MAFHPCEAAEDKSFVDLYTTSWEQRTASSRFSMFRKTEKIGASFRMTWDVSINTNRSHVTTNFVSTRTTPEERKSSHYVLQAKMPLCLSIWSERVQTLMMLRSQTPWSTFPTKITSQVTASCLPPLQVNLYRQKTKLLSTPFWPLNASSSKWPRIFRKHTARDGSIIFFPAQKTLKLTLNLQ